MYLRGSLIAAAVWLFFRLQQPKDGKQRSEDAAPQLGEVAEQQGGASRRDRCAGLRSNESGRDSPHLKHMVQKDVERRKRYPITFTTPHGDKQEGHRRRRWWSSASPDA
eukprot:gene29157-55603_t